jgi:2-polyprenyl-3-methyl-5-hydroxy-6-metoxy-1,4-benzoquinol methylase
MSVRTGDALRDLVAAVTTVWPEHESYLRERFADAGSPYAATASVVADRILRVVGDRLGEAVANYRWTCEHMLQEEYFFRRHKRYRHTSFEEVRRLVYDEPDFMRRYADGLLLSQLFWANHTGALHAYRTDFMGRLPEGASLLEVGPGHGLLLALAAERPGRGVITGWDISDTSLRATAAALAAMRVQDVELARHDLFAAPADRSFDAVVASEVLEHLEQPAEALARLRGLTRPGGLVFLNVPVNSPAPDHIYLWRDPGQIRELAIAAGLDVLTAHAIPMTGRNLDEARRLQLTVSCVVIARRPLDERCPSV